MSEDHRRVEPRQIVGTGMATDAERITQIGDDAARRERAWRHAPEVAFGAVLDRTPARPPEDDPDPQERRRSRSGDEDDAAAASAPALPPTPSTTTAAREREPASSTRPPLRNAIRAPDPRAALLHARWDKGRPGSR